MKSRSVSLAGRQYTVESLKFKAERAWRKKYDKPIGDLMDSISGVSALGSKEYDKTGDLVRELGTVLLARAGDLVKALLNSPDTLLDAICDYSPAIAADREWIEENAYQDEIAQVFVEVLQIAYPFGSLLGILRNLGSAEKPIAVSSLSPSGVSSTTN